MSRSDDVVDPEEIVLPEHLIHQVRGRISPGEECIIIFCVESHDC